MKRYGWFEYEGGTQAIRNYLTGQCLRINSAVDVANRRTFKCVYSDNEISQLISFSISKVQGGRAKIYLNYGDSMIARPEYGVWRRIDDFTVDALLCWPEFLDSQAFSLVTRGGWRSGTWNPELNRWFSGRKSGSIDQLKNYVVAEPYVIPINTPVPRPWIQYDVSPSATEASLVYGEIEGTGIPFLPRSSPVEGFQGQVPYLASEDGEAYIFFSKLQPSSHRGEEPETLLYYTYIDQDIFFTFRSHPCYKNELGTAIDYGFREFPPRRELWAMKPLGELVSGETPRQKENVMSKLSYLAYPIWLRVMHALGDAWPAWSTPRKPVEIDKKISLPPSVGRRGYVGDYGPTISHGFSAGMANSWFELRFPDA